MSADTKPLTQIVSRELDRDLSPVVITFAERLKTAHGDGVVAVLAYGSCLRDTALDDSLIDFYVLTGTLVPITTNPLSRWLCRLVPPNVYYREEAIKGQVYRAKYAALPIDVFKRRVGAGTSNPYFWARFSQPVALAWCKDSQTRQEVTEAICEAVRTMIGKIGGESVDADDIRDVWVNGLQNTYQSELRSEGPARAQQIVDANFDFYAAITKAVADDSRAGGVAEQNWARVQRRGKLLSVLRLLKAAFTFSGGADYLAWKISRHSGQKVELTAWQRRHPILASIVLFPKLLRSGAVK